MSRSFAADLAVARAQADTARAQTKRVIAQAADASTAASVLRVQALALDAERAAAVARADSVAQAARRLRSSYTAIARVAPDTCRPAIVAADSALAAHDSIEHDLRVALQRSQEARSLVEAALDTTKKALRLLSASSSNLVAADAALAKRSRPSFLARLIPHPGVGVAAGLDPNMKPRVITGITLGWSF